MSTLPDAGLLRGAPAMKPVLGVTSCNRSTGGEPAQSVMNRYVTAAMTWGEASALLVPALPHLADARAVAARLDGLLLTGSPSNVETARYGQSAPDAAGPFDPGRDGMALGLIDAMLALGRPVFGICRGLQEINVAFGGTLARDVGSSGALAHHAPEGASLEAMFAHAHEVALSPGGVLAEATGRERLVVNSVHYQGVGRLGSGLAVEARASDGLVEAVRSQSAGSAVLAVQWHPEWNPAQDADAQAFFRLLGRALRGDCLRATSSATL